MTKFTSEITSIVRPLYSVPWVVLVLRFYRICIAAGSMCCHNGNTPCVCRPVVLLMHKQGSSVQHCVYQEIEEYIIIWLKPSSMANDWNVLQYPADTHGMSGHRAWLCRGYWCYRNLIDWQWSLKLGEWLQCQIQICLSVSHIKTPVTVSFVSGQK